MTVQLGKELLVIPTQNTLKDFNDLMNSSDEPFREVVITNSIDDNICILGLIPGLNNEHLHYQVSFAYDLELGDQGLVYAANDDVKHNNILKSNSAQMVKLADAYKNSVYVIGRIVNNDQEFRVFDFYIGPPGQGRYALWEELTTVSAAVGFAVMPVVYAGTYDEGIVDMLYFDPAIKHGIMIKSQIEADPRLIAVAKK
jgi:hypothetical protein